MSFSRRILQYLTISSLLVLQLLPVVSADVSLAAFEADYELFYGKWRAADAQLSLARTGDSWRLRLLTEPRGLLSLVTNKKPYSETTFARIDGNLRLQKLTIADDGEKDKQLETARFDWSSQQVEMLRKDITTTAVLSGEVYDYLSVHLLSAKMQAEKLQQVSVYFYYKGRLVKLDLKQLDNVRLTIGEKEVDTMVYEQSLEGSSTKSIYYYDPGTPYIPMKIESIKPGRKTTTMVYVPDIQ